MGAPGAPPFPPHPPGMGPPQPGFQGSESSFNVFVWQVLMQAYILSASVPPGRAPFPPQRYKHRCTPGWTTLPPS